MPARLPGRGEHLLEPLAVLGGHEGDHGGDLGQQVGAADGAPHEFGGDGRAPAGRRVVVGDRCLLHGCLHALVRGAVEEGQCHGGDAHERAVARTAPERAVRGLGRTVDGGLAQRGAGDDAHIGGVGCPHRPAREQVGGVHLAVLHERLGECQRHLRVVGELARPPAEAATAQHLAAPAHDGLRERRAVAPGGLELERRAEGVADGGADECADGGVLVGGVHRVGVSKVVRRCWSVRSAAGQLAGARSCSSASWK